MVDLRTRMREMRGDHHEKLGFKRISCASQFTIPDTAGTSPNPACNYTDTKSSQPNQASRTPDFSYPLVSSTSFSSSSPISLFLVHNSTIIAEHKVKWSLSISPCHDHELTPSTAYTESSMHRVQHTPSTQDCLSSLHSHDYELTPECSFSFRRAFLHNRPPSASSPWELKGKVTLSHSHSCELTNWWIESQHPVRSLSTASKYSSKLAPLRPPSVSPNSLDYGLHKCISNLPRSRSRSASLSSLDHGLQVYLQIPSTTASMCISKVARSRPRSVSLSSLDRHFQAHLELLSSATCSQSRYTVCRSVAI